MFPPGFTCPAVLWIQLAVIGFRLRDSHPLWCAFPHTSTNLLPTRCCPYPEDISTLGLASSAFARHYLRNLVWFLFLALLRCFSSGGSLHIPILFSICWLIYYQPGCPIRKSADIMPAYDSPQLFAVNHVLLRLPVPRHSPCALCSLTCFYSFSASADNEFIMRSSKFEIVEFSLVDNCNLYYPYSKILCLFKTVDTVSYLSFVLQLLCSVFKVRC